MGREIMYSVIVVCLNAGQKLCDTVESVLRQDNQNFEVVKTQTKWTETFIFFFFSHSKSVCLV